MDSVCELEDRLGRSEMVIIRVGSIINKGYVMRDFTGFPLELKTYFSQDQDLL